MSKLIVETIEVGNISNAGGTKSETTDNIIDKNFGKMEIGS